MSVGKEEGDKRKGGEQEGGEGEKESENREGEGLLMFFKGHHNFAQTQNGGTLLSLFHLHSFRLLSAPLRSLLSPNFSLSPFLPPNIEIR